MGWKRLPYGISKDKIPLISRIISIVDSYDAITNDRPYRRALVDEFVNLVKMDKINKLIKV